LGAALGRVAIFVDAGYLYAQGSAAVYGAKRPRVDLILDAPAAISELKKVSELKARGCSLLRIYWYDGARGRDLSPEQALLASLDDVKVRLGSVNTAGDQKGVDSLIVTDLIELARQKAISDALLLSGDEDVRVGVQIAQNYGVRVHLLGIVPSRGSQSIQLIREADTTQEWPSETVTGFLSVRSTPPVATAVTEEIVVLESTTAIVHSVATSTLPKSFDPTLELATKEFVDSLEDAELDSLEAYWKSGRGMPSDFDRVLLPRCRDAIGRNLAQDEKRFVRSRFQKMVQQRLSSRRLASS
jgi:uncharacterized LabA/DUF88 family protein